MARGNALRTAIERAWWSSRHGLLVWLLWPLSLVYRALWWVRSVAYATGLKTARRAPVPVVVVGNVIVGGAGKSPTVMALAAALRSEGWRPGILSRGHGSALRHPRAVAPDSRPDDVGDEPLLMVRRTGMPVWVGHDRVATARALCVAHPEVNLLIADDGLQHLALHRDAQVVVFDARGVGNGWMLPAGPLREPAWTSVPARTVVIYNASQPSTPLPGHLAARSLGYLLPLRAWWAADPTQAIDPRALQGQALLAAAGIGQPERFFSMLQAQGLQFERLPLPDHAVFTPRPWPLPAPCVIVTEKDAVKLPATAPDAGTIVVATLDFALPATVIDTLRAWLPAAPKP